MLRRPSLLVPSFLFLAAGCAQPPPPDTEAARASLSETAARYGEAVAAQDKDAFLAFYASDAVMYPPGAASLTGLPAIGEFVGAAFGDAAFEGNLDPPTVEVSADGTLGTTFGTGEITLTGPDGKPVTERIRDLHVWRRQADGSWKLAIDVWNAEPEPAAQPMEK